MLLDRVVNQNVDLAEFAHLLSDDLLTKLFVPDISIDHQTFPSPFFHQTFCRLRVLMFLQIGDGNIGIFFGKDDCDRSTDSAVASRNKSNFPLQLSAAALFFVLSSGARLHFVLAAGLSISVLRRLKFLFFRHAKEFACSLVPPFLDVRTMVCAATP